MNPEPLNLNLDLDLNLNLSYYALMNIQLPYGRGFISCVLPSDKHVEVLRPAVLISPRCVEDILANSLANPINSVPFLEFIKRGAPITIIVPDKTRRSGVSHILPFLLKILHSEGYQKKDIRILFANGTHGPQTEEEKCSILGNEIFNSYQIFENDPHSTENFVDVGLTAAGTEVSIHRLVVESKTVISMGAISHHYFAGFGGGAKLLVPGVCSYKTVLQNHNLTITEDGDFHPGCREGTLDGNPVYCDIVEAYKLCPPMFYFGILLDADGAINEIVCGESIAAHRKGAEIADSMFRIPITHRSDVVIAGAGGYPRDITMIQSHKTIQHVIEAVRPEGTIICCAECHDGMGSPTFLEWFSYRTISDMKTALQSHYTLNGHTALSLKKKSEAVRIFFVSELSPDNVRKMGMIPANSLEEAVQLAFVEKTYHTILIIENGAAYLPTLQNTVGVC